jgi:phenylacetate-coenzyme A ligase PaaK-like adenylate-forming protein
MRILNPQREAETVWVAGTPFNRVDIERSVFQRPNMEYTTGEYESTLYHNESGDTVLKVNLECFDPPACDKNIVEENFLRSFFKYKPALEHAYKKQTFRIELNYLPPRTLNIYQAQGRPKRLIDLRHAKKE